MDIAFSTAFSRLLESRQLCRASAVALGIHGTLLALGLPGWQCPIRHGLGVPCPGCGLSRSMAALIQGDWHQSLLIHAFAPIAIAAIAFIVASAILPAPQHTALVSGIRTLEQKTGITLLFLTGLILYWLVRLIFFHEALYTLVM
jgi:hypothetical protein